MIVTIVHVYVNEESIDAFIRATVKNHEASVKEPGNLRFDFIQNTGEPGRFVLYEAYESEESAAAHKHTAHYLAWREEVADMMAEPREGIRYNGIKP